MNYPGLESLKYYLGFLGEPLVEPPTELGWTPKLHTLAPVGINQFV